MSFNLIVPCYVAFSLEETPSKSKLHLKISTSEFNIFFFTNNSTKQIKANINNWAYLRTNEVYVAFLNVNHIIDTIFYFLNDPLGANLKRFLFAITEAGTLIPPSFSILSEMKFIPKHSFVPQGQYQYIKKTVAYQLGAIIYTKLISITDDGLPFNTEFIDLVVPKFHTRAWYTINKWYTQEDKHNKIQKFKNLNCKILLNWLTKHSPIQKNYQDIKQEIKGTPALEKYFKLIDDDISSFIQEIQAGRQDNHFNRQKNLIEICRSVLKVHVYKTKIPYFKGNIEIVKNICLLMKGQSNIPNDSSYVPDSIQYLSDSEFEMYLYSFYHFFKKPFGFKSNDNSTYMDNLIDDITNIANDIFSQEIPQLLPVFRSHNISKFKWIENDFHSLFSKSFNNIWPIWCLLYSARKTLQSFASINAALLFLAIPQIIEKKIYSEDQILKFWPEHMESMNSDRDKLMDATFYFYHNYSINDKNHS